MDKIKIGNYLKNLRKSKIRESDCKPFTQEDLASVFSDNGITISVNAIKEWENGNSLPTPENLDILSKLYNKTIDEILEGEDRKEFDYKEIYYTYDNSWMKKAAENKLFEFNQKNIVKVVSRFKELIQIRIKRHFNSNEEPEFKFLFENFYDLTDYAINYDICRPNVTDKYLRLKNVINQMLEIDIRSMDSDEKYWEIRKLYKEKNTISFSHWRNIEDLQKKIGLIEERFNILDDWQKDMYLAMYQNIETFQTMEEFHDSRDIKKYEEENGEYDLDKIKKNEIRELINRGAMLNKYFLNVKVKKVEEKRIIDRLEELYDLCLKPIGISIKDSDGYWQTVRIENNLKNRFIDEYYFSLSCFLNRKDKFDSSYDDIEETYKFFIENDTLIDEDRKKVAKNHGINVNREKKYWLADYNNWLAKLEEKNFLDFKRKEIEISNGLKEIEDLKQLLEKGERYYTVTKYITVGGTDEETIKNYVEYSKSKIDYSEFLHKRDKKLTKELLHDLDLLSFSEIKEKYFKEVVINE